MPSIQCFVACAFGDNEVDAIYQNAIEPAVRRIGAVPARVDRVEHNDDIDDKIMELLQSSDLVIADLTFARPSVYYEAGYFAGLGKPVVYTVRKDHFTPDPNDVHGNRRVHFDLQMKNIIDWTSTSKTRTFQSRLESRIRHVIAPMLRQKRELDRQAAEAATFSRLSQKSKLAALHEVVFSLLAYYSWAIEHRSRRISTAPTKANILAAKGSTHLSVYLTNSATKEVLRWVNSFRLWEEFGRRLGETGPGHAIIVSLRSIPSSRIEDMYPDADRLESFESSYKQADERRGAFYLHFLSGIKSQPAFRDQVSRLFAALEET